MKGEFGDKKVPLVDFSSLLNTCRKFSSLSALAVALNGFCKHAHILTWRKDQSDLLQCKQSFKMVADQAFKIIFIFDTVASIRALIKVFRNWI